MSHLPDYMEISDDSSPEIYDSMSQQDMLSVLTPREQQVSNLYFVEGYEAKDVAKILKCGRQNVYEFLARIRKKIAKQSNLQVYEHKGRSKLIANLMYMYMITMLPREMTFDEVMSAWTTHPVLSDYWPLYPSSMERIYQKLKTEIYENQ